LRAILWNTGFLEQSCELADVHAAQLYIGRHVAKRYEHDVMAAHEFSLALQGIVIWQQDQKLRGVIETA